MSASVIESAIRRTLLPALERVHASKWTHRDVKPENILIANGVAKLADFGEATEFANEDARRTYVGTRWYRAPEQFLLADEVRRPGAADVWAAGCVLVECLLGHALFRGASDADMLRKIAETIGARGVDAETAASFARLAENGVAPRGDGRLEEIVRGQNPAASPAASIGSARRSSRSSWSGGLWRLGHSSSPARCHRGPSCLLLKAIVTHSCGR